MNLYKIKLKGCGNHQESYVVAENVLKAYDIVRKYLDDGDYGFKHDRDLDSAELLASEHEKETRTPLFIGKRGWSDAKIKE